MKSDVDLHDIYGETHRTTGYQSADRATDRKEKRAVKNILLQLTSYPLRTPPETISAAAAIANLFPARLSAAVCRIEVPDPSNFLARRLAHVSEAIDTENNKSRTAADAMTAEFQAATAGREPAGEARLIHCRGMLQSAELVELARVHDLTIMPIHADTDTQFVAQDLIFGAGRPILLLPEAAPSPATLGTVVAGWDGSRAAARAIADALPLLRRAAGVRLVTVTGDKEMDAADSIHALRRHLRFHDVEAMVDSIAAAGDNAGKALTRYCQQINADMLVMGAYGHSRMRDFVVGGATKNIMAEAALPVLLSH